jgi:protein tyrosine/serine phosphatase
MSANREPNEALLTRLIETLRTVEMPVVIHCEGGADRTGLAAALYELLVMGRSAEVASAQLSFRYGHFPWLTSRTGAMDATFWRVAAENSVKLQAEMPE